ncbi:MAG: nucleotidyl transferase AbiEii/AbiGii toxin family protein [Alphaproteobacteria bacterium]
MNAPAKLALPSVVYLMLDNNLYSRDMMKLLRDFSAVLGKLGIQAKYIETTQGFREKSRDVLHPSVDATENGGRVSSYTQLYKDHPDWFELIHTQEADDYLAAFRKVIVEKVMPAMWHNMTGKQQAAYRDAHPGFDEPASGEVQDVPSAYTYVREIQRKSFKILQHSGGNPAITQAEDIDVFNPALLQDTATPLAMAILQAYNKELNNRSVINAIVKTDEEFQAARFNSGDRSWPQVIRNNLTERPDASNSVVVVITDDGPAVEELKNGIGQDNINKLDSFYVLSGTGFMLLINRMIRHLEKSGKDIQMADAEAARKMLERDAGSQYWQQSIRRDENLVSGAAPKLSDRICDIIQRQTHVAPPPETGKEEIVVKNDKAFPQNPNYEEHLAATVRLVGAMHKLSTKTLQEEYQARQEEKDGQTLLYLDEGSRRSVEKAPGFFTLHGSARNGLYFYPVFARKIGDVDFRFTTNPHNAGEIPGDHEPIIRQQLEGAGFTDITTSKEKTRSGEVRRIKFDMAYLSPADGQKYGLSMDVNFSNMVPLLPTRQVRFGQTFSGFQKPVQTGPNPILIEHPFEILGNKLVALVDNRGGSKEARLNAKKQAKNIFDATQYLNRHLGYPGEGGFHDDITGLYLAQKNGTMWLMSPDNPITRLRFNLEVAEKLAQPNNAGALARMGIHDQELLLPYLMEVYRESYGRTKYLKQHDQEFDETAHEEQARKRILEFTRIAERLLEPFRALSPTAGVKLQQVNTPEAEFVRLLKQGIVDPGMLLRPKERFEHYKAAGWRNDRSRLSFKEKMEAFFSENGHPELITSVDMDKLERALYERIAGNTLLRSRAEHYAIRKSKKLTVVGPDDPPPALGTQIT